MQEFSGRYMKTVALYHGREVGQKLPQDLGLENVVGFV